MPFTKPTLLVAGVCMTSIAAINCITHALPPFNTFNLHSFTIQRLSSRFPTCAGPRLEAARGQNSPASSSSFSTASAGSAKLKLTWRHWRISLSKWSESLQSMKLCITIATVLTILNWTSIKTTSNDQSKNHNPPTSSFSTARPFDRRAVGISRTPNRTWRISARAFALRSGATDARSGQGRGFGASGASGAAGDGGAAPRDASAGISCGSDSGIGTRHGSWVQTWSHTCVSHLCQTCFEYVGHLFTVLDESVCTATCKCFVGKGTRPTE